MGEEDPELEGQWARHPQACRGSDLDQGELAPDLGS